MGVFQHNWEDCRKKHIFANTDDEFCFGHVKFGVSDMQVKVLSSWLGQQAVKSQQVEHPTQEL